MRYVELTVCWLLELNPGQLNRVLCSWSSRLHGNTWSNRLDVVGEELPLVK